MSRRLAYLALLGLLTAATLGGCESSFVGTLNLTISGAPLVGTRNVVLAITGVQVGGDGGETDFDVAPEESVDLDNADRLSVLDGLVPAGDYKWVRLDIDVADSYVIAANGDRYPLQVTPVYQATQEFTVGEGLTASMLVDIDLRKTLMVTTQGSMPVYTLQPLAQLINLQRVGEIVGIIPPSMMIGSLSVTDPSCDLEVYVYPGAGAVPEGFFVPVKGGTEPFSSSLAPVFHPGQDLYTFAAEQLPPGTYTLAVTCAAFDVPGGTHLDFSATQTGVVTPSKNGTVIFP